MVASSKARELKSDVGNVCMLESHILEKQLWRGGEHKEGTEAMCEHMQ